MVEAQPYTSDNRATVLLEGINRVFREALHCQTDSQLAELCLAVAEEISGSKFGFIGEVNSDNRLDTIAISNPGWNACGIPESDAVRSINNMVLRGIWARALKDETSIIVNEPASHPDSVGVPEGHPALTSFLGIPLKDGNSTFGMIALANKDGGYTKTDVVEIEKLSISFVETLLRKRAELKAEQAYAELERKVELRTAELAGALKDIEQQNEVFKIIWDSFPEILYVSDPVSNEVIYANKVLVEGLGKDPTGGQCHKEIQNLDQPCSFCTNERLLKEGEPIVWEHYNPVIKRHYYITDQLVPWPDGRKVRFEVATDITEKKVAEENLAKALVELERSNKDLEQFAYVASHDLQEPLRGVAGCLQILEKSYGEKLDDRAKELIDHAVKGAVRMKSLTNDLLTYSRINTHGKTKEPTLIQEILPEVEANLSRGIAETGAEILYNALPTVQADRVQMIQLFQNLFSNSIKFCGKDTPKIIVTAEQKNGEWVFAVKDNGIGFDEEYAERIFMVFQRLHTRSKYSGTGIGLAVCKKIVERHGGRIWVESKPEQGSTFFFTIPIEEEQL